MRRTTPMRVGALLDDWLRDAPGIARKIAEAKVCDHWARVAGPHAARCTTRTEMRGGVLYVQVTSSVIRSELFMRRGTLRDALNEAVGVEVVRTVIIK